MELNEFTGTLAQMTPANVHAVARSHAAHHGSPADEIDAFRAVVHIDTVLRKHARTRDAAHAAYAATRAVTFAAEAGDILLPDPEVTQVARAAALIARGIVAGDEADPDVRWLLLEWSTLFAPA
jgi:hypothetical protein